MNLYTYKKNLKKKDKKIDKIQAWPHAYFYNVFID